MTKRIMAIDVGDARIGVAITDPLGLFPQPHSSIERSEKNPVESLLQLIDQLDVGTLVIGMPFEPDGMIGPQGRKVEKLSEKLRAELVLRKKDKGKDHVLLEFLDERFTTQAAKKIVVGSKLKNKEYSSALDRVSASLILENYLASQLL